MAISCLTLNALEFYFSTFFGGNVLGAPKYETKKHCTNFMGDKWSNKSY